jgi:hypothetical protein|tara:strand:+ start:1323 stop:2219 length:897 start_codon:yes stop_codon:yes gene_type:complete
MGVKSKILGFTGPTAAGAGSAISDANLKEIEFMPSTLETIDAALFKWLDEELNISATTNKGWKKVPTIWAGSERAHQLKKDKDVRDSSGVLKLPIITVSRESVNKDSNFKGVAWAHIPNKNDAKGGAITTSRRIGQIKTSNFKNAFSHREFKDYNFPANKRLTVYETISMPTPTYISLMYSIQIRAEYQQQINEILTPFIVNTGQIDNFFINNEGHKFEGFIQGDFGQANNIVNMSTNERTYQTTIQAKILGYLLGSGPNEERPKISIRENAVTLIQVRERATLGEKETQDGKKLLET